MFVAFETSLFSAAIFPFRLCTSLIVFGGVSSIIAHTFSRLTSIPLWETMNPRNFPTVTPNTHLLEFNFILSEGVESLLEVAQMIVFS